MSLGGLYLYYISETNIKKHRQKVPGHATRSINVIEQFIKLKDYEKEIILYHMELFGTFDHEKGFWHKNLTLLQSQCKLLQLETLIILITRKIAHKDKDYSIKLRKYYFCTIILN